MNIIKTIIQTNGKYISVKSARSSKSKNHYKTPEEALEKWETRKRRIDPDNLYIIGCEKDGCTYETIQRFDKLPYKNKAILTKQEYPEFNSAWYLPGFEDCEALGTVTNFKDQFSKRRYMDDFDYITFLNNGVKN